MYLGNTHTATVAGSVMKLVRCEQCDHEYGYQMSRKAIGEGFSVLGLDDKNSAVNAQTQAGKRLRRKLAKSCDPVPCPECGLYQPAMVERLRVIRFKRLDGPVIGLILAPIFGSLIGGELFRHLEQPMVGFGVLFAISWSLAIMIGLARLWLNRVIDPNSRSADARIALGKRLSVSKKEFLRLASEDE